MTEKGLTIFEAHEDYPHIIVVVCYLAVFSVAGSIGNAFVIYIFSKQRDKSTTTIFILSLAWTDFFTCLIIVPYTIYYEAMSKRINNDIACKVYQFLITSNVPFSAFIMVIIAFDRYFKICRPWNQIIKVKQAKRILFGVFLFVVVLGIITALTHGVVQAGSTDTDPYGYAHNKTPCNDSNCVFNVRHSSLYNGSVIDVTSTYKDQRSISKNIYIVNDTKVILESKGNYGNKIGMCKPTTRYLSIKFLLFYQKFYASLFLISFIFVVILYTLILRSIVVRRSLKLQRSMISAETQRTSEAAHNLSNTCIVLSRLTATENGNIETVRNSSDFTEERNHKYKLIRDKQMIANIRTAGILFIVTIVFIIAFLPAWLMATGVIKPDMIIFYMYYIYNVANPIIYAFCNQTFRKEVKRVLKC